MMKMQRPAIRIKVCPTCGSRRIRRVTRDVSGMWLGKHPYIAPKVNFYECPVCGERIFDPAALRKIQLFRPKLGKSDIRRKAS